jgi:ribosomal protein S6--L-glutamate ligase
VPVFNSRERKVAMKKNQNSLLQENDWCEWVAFPALKVPAIEAQIVSDAKYSTLNIFDSSTFKQGEDLMISFGIYPIQDNVDVEIYAVACVNNRRMLTDSNGERQWCYSIETEMRHGALKKTIELVLVKNAAAGIRLHLCSRALKKNGRLHADTTTSGERRCSSIPALFPYS